jgi:hypothetical protein
MGERERKYAPCLHVMASAAKQSSAIKQRGGNLGCFRVSRLCLIFLPLPQRPRCFYALFPRFSNQPSKAALPASYQSLITCYLSLITCYQSLITYYLSLITYSQLSIYDSLDLVIIDPRVSAEDATFLASFIAASP